MLKTDLLASITPEPAQPPCMLHRSGSLLVPFHRIGF